MDRVYGFLLMILLLGLAFIADLVAYIKVGGDFFIIGLFLLGVLLVLSVFLYTTLVSKLCALALFSITLLTGVTLFKALFPVNKEILAVLLIVGSIGFVMNIACYGKCSKKRRRIRMPPMPLPAEPVFAQKLGPLTISEPLDKDEEFLELDEVEKLVQKKGANNKPKRRTRRKKK